MFQENLINAVQAPCDKKVNMKLNELPCLQNISILHLYMYSQLALYIQNKNVAFINELASYDEIELMAKLNVTKDVCDYIYSKIDHYYMNSVFPQIICPNLPAPCLFLEITILRLAPDIIRILKNYNIYTLGELAVIKIVTAKIEFQFGSTLNEIVKACQLVVDDFRRSLLFPQKHNEDSEKESNIICNNDSVKVEKVLKNKTLESLYVPRLNFNIDWFEQTEKNRQNLQDLSQKSPSLDPRNNINIQLPVEQIEQKPKPRLKEYLDAEKSRQQELQIEDVFNLEKIIEFMSKRPIITEDEIKFLSWEEIAHKLTFFWDVPLKELNISLDNFIGIENRNITIIGDILSLILENNLKWLKSSDLSSGTISPSALKITPILLQAKEYRDKIKAEPSPNTKSKIINKISTVLKTLIPFSFLKG